MTRKLPFIKLECGSQTYWYVPGLSFSVTDFLPVNETPVITLLRPGPDRWKSWLDDLSFAKSAA